MPQTLILVKPDAFERSLTGEILARFENKGLKIVALKKLTATEAIANEHYAEHTEKPFFGELVEFITGGPLVAAVLEGPEAVEAARQLIGSTNPVEAAPGSIRGDFARSHLQHGPRQRLRRVSRPRDRNLVPRALGAGRRNRCRAPALVLASASPAAPRAAAAARNPVRDRRPRPSRS